MLKLIYLCCSRYEAEMTPRPQTVEKRKKERKEPQLRDSGLMLHCFMIHHISLCRFIMTREDRVSAEQSKDTVIEFIP
jgi:hypothetical protein